MKKIMTLFLATFMLLNLVACGNKLENSNKPESTQHQDSESNEEQDSENTEPEFEGDPVEYSMDYWAEKYPDQNICPFGIEVDGVETPYYLIMELGCSMEEWIETPFNWNGWHKVGEDIVNKEETYKITAEWLGDEGASNFSSCCTITTEPYDPSVVTD